jgi:putative ABC transport system permease protein
MRWWELFRQALAGAARAKLRSTLTALGVAIGCGALVSMIAFALGLQHELESPLKKFGFLNEIHVWQKSDDDDQDKDKDSDKDKEDNDRESPASRSAQEHYTVLDAAALADIRKIPGVKFAYSNVSLHNVKLTRGQSEADALIFALPREAAMTQVVSQFLTKGRFIALGDAPEVLIAERLLDDLKFESPTAALNQEIEVSAAGLAATDEPDQFQFRRKSLKVRIVGVFQAPELGPFGGSLGRRTVVMPADLIEQLPGRVEGRLWRLRRGDDAPFAGLDSVTVRAENPAIVPRIAKTIRARGFNTQTVIGEVEDMRTAFLFIESLLTAVGSVALVIAGLGIANTLLMTVLERYEEIGLYKAIGATDGDVRLMFMAEAAALGFVGSLMGLALAGVVCWGLQWGVSTYLASEGVKRHVDVFYFPWWLLASGVAFSTLLSVLSGLYPASRAARVDPIEALRRA